MKVSITVRDNLATCSFESEHGDTFEDVTAFLRKLSALFETEKVEIHSRTNPVSPVWSLGGTGSIGTTILPYNTNDQYKTPG